MRQGGSRGKGQREIVWVRGLTCPGSQSTMMGVRRTGEWFFRDEDVDGFDAFSAGTPTVDAGEGGGRLILLMVGVWKEAQRSERLQYETATADGDTMCINLHRHIAG